MPPLLSICIPTWNRAESLSETLDSLASILPTLPSGSVELCLSDNASTDDTPRIVQEAKSLACIVRTKRLSENVSFSSNYWSAASLASGRYTWITGDDDQFDIGGLMSLVITLSDCRDDLLFLNSSPWKEETRTLEDQPINGIEEYLAKLGIFHASFIGNSVFSTASLHEYLNYQATLASAYPQMASVFGILASSRCLFLNVRPVIIDDSMRSWRERQPLLTSIDMARLASDLAFGGGSCGLATRARTYSILMRSLPRAVSRATRGITAIDSFNPYQSLSARNILQCYNGVPLAGPVACLVAAVCRIAAGIRPERSR